MARARNSNTNARSFNQSNVSYHGISLKNSLLSSFSVQKKFEKNRTGTEPCSNIRLEFFQEYRNKTIQGLSNVKQSKLGNIYLDKTRLSH